MTPTEPLLVLRARRPVRRMELRSQQTAPAPTLRAHLAIRRPLPHRLQRPPVVIPQRIRSRRRPRPAPTVSQRTVLLRPPPAPTPTEILNRQPLRTTTG